MVATEVIEPTVYGYNDLCDSLIYDIGQTVDPLGNRLGRHLHEARIDR